MPKSFISFMKTGLLALILVSCSNLNGSGQIQFPCDFRLQLGLTDQAACGYIEVPENHGQPKNHKIKIAYVVLKARNPDSQQHPVIYFSGGPGSASLTPGNIYRWTNGTIRNNRDVILFDQRGINLSSPLPNMETKLFEVMAKNADSDHELSLIIDLFDHYKTKSLDQGVSLQYYNTFQNARDVGLLMDYLGYEKYNLYGGSYGTRLARLILDLYPTKINSVVLNSPSLLRGDFLVSRLFAYSQALERVFKYCGDNSNCKARYPNLKSDYFAALKSLREDPLQIQIDTVNFYVNPQDAIYLIRRDLYGADSRESVPELISALKNRSTSSIEDIIRNELLFSRNYNSSMWLSVERYEQFNSKYSTKVIDSIYQTLPLFPEKLGLFNSMYFAGKNWHQSELPIKQRVFKKSDIPAIIFVNQYDPVTPPENGYQMQEKLSMAKLFILDEGGHGGGNMLCREEIINAFMDNPLQEIDSSCLNLVNID